MPLVSIIFCPPAGLHTAAMRKYSTADRVHGLQPWPSLDVSDRQRAGAAVSTASMALRHVHVPFWGRCHCMPGRRLWSFCLCRWSAKAWNPLLCHTVWHLVRLGSRYFCAGSKTVLHHCGARGTHPPSQPPRPPPPRSGANQEGDTCIEWTSQYCWTNGWNGLWRGHSVDQNRPLIPPKWNSSCDVGDIR